MVYIAGAPGAGKGTLCAKLAHDMSKTGICLYLSVGEHLRALCTPEKHLLNKRFRGVLSYDELKQYVDSRELVPALNMGHIVNAWYEMYRPAPNVKVLADGFPRDLETAKIADRQFGPPHRILFIHCPEDIARQRFLELRRSADDPDAVFSKRYDEFAIQNGAIVEHYQDSKLIKVCLKDHGCWPCYLLVCILG